MKSLNLITLLLVILGGLNWLLIGLFNYNLVAEIFGSFSRLIYVLVGLSALYQLIPFWQAVSTDEVIAETTRARRDL